jgi:SAM-dependent methyltransferase
MEHTLQEQEARKHWDALHGQPRFRLRWPSEHVVRFLIAHFPTEPRTSAQALDIGVGGGRHTKLLCDLGFRTYGVDISGVGLQHCADWLHRDGQTAVFQEASMLRLPFADNQFDTALAFGVYYYSDRAGMSQGIAELHRILRPGAPAFVVVRTTNDYRFGKGTTLEPSTFRLGIRDTNEYQTVQHFLTETDVPARFASFSKVCFEKTETTFQQRHAVNSDWLITVTK